MKLLTTMHLGNEWHSFFWPKDHYPHHKSKISFHYCWKGHQIFHCSLTKFWPKVCRFSENNCKKVYFDLLCCLKDTNDSIVNKSIVCGSRQTQAIYLLMNIYNLLEHWKLTTFMNNRLGQWINWKDNVFFTFSVRRKAEYKIV